MNSFYEVTAVRQRLIEFLGGDSLNHATALCLTHMDGCQFDRYELKPPSELDWFLQRDMDIARSLADSRSHLLHLDMEYVNFDSPTEVFIDPWRCFELQEPVVKALESLLTEWGIQPLHLITGRGHHFVWRIGRDSALAHRLMALCPAPELIGPCMDRIPPLLRGSTDASDQAVFLALALLMEYVAHLAKQRAAPHSYLPVEITAVHVRPSVTKHREMISIDISEYGDPLHSRVIRMPFTNYLKPWASGLTNELGLAAAIPAFRAIPLHEIDYRQAIKVRQVDKAMVELAQCTSTRIHLEEEGTCRLLDDYMASRLRRFHEFYYSTQHDPMERWPETYDRTPVAELPFCVRHVLEYPNDLLLKPAGMQMVTRYLLAVGWHPRHIAGLIRSKFENPVHEWGRHWEDDEAGTRADFYTRLFAGLTMTGVEQVGDFNCTATREKGFCFMPPDSSCNLDSVLQNLLSKQTL